MKPGLWLASGIALACLACEVGPQSGHGLRLPEGDVARGELAFQELGCPRCHDVAGGPEFPAEERAETIVRLGGAATRIETYGELVTSIVNPSHELSWRYPTAQVAEGDASKMSSFNERMTVAQLIDLVAFLQAKYEIPFHSL